ncbi:Signal transduction histidine kinase [hydrothermal vent metagenome]|uniref:Signal transduction histidine kinase n=1 Tax=hydrothermal vent metagenome TaxID=652676 RepID=A0A3B1CW81_9ZZZZ
MKKSSYYSLQTKLIVLFLGISFFSIVIVAGISLMNSRKSITVLSAEKVQSEISLNAHYIEAVMSEYRADLRLLANTPPPRAMIRATYNKGVDPVSSDDLYTWKKRFITILEATLKSKRFYQQAYFLYEGKEILRVNFENGKTVIVKEEDFQDKHEVIYFKEALKLREGEVYISELSLNREKGKIQIPYTPVLRFSMPVFAQGVKTPGVLVLNVYAESFLKNLNDGSGRIYLTNEQGFYLYHKDSSRTFGFDLGNKTDTLLNDFPEVMQNFHSQESYNSFSGEEDIFLQKIHFDTRNLKRYWLIAKDVPVENILAPANDLRQKVFYLILIISPFIFLLALMVSRGITSPVKNLVDLVNKLAKGNFDLEDQSTSSSRKKSLFNIAQTREIKQLELSVEQMRKNLRDTTVAEQKAKEELEQALWMSQSRESLNKQMQGIGEKLLLARNIITSLVDLVKADIGGVYLCENEHTLRLIASHAFDSRTDNHNVFQLGEGLVGQAALEKKTILFTDISENPSMIDYGLGKTQPKYFLVVPFFYEDKTKGVIVLGSVQSMQGLQKQFIEEVGGDIGIALNTVQSRERIEKLLKETKDQSEELKIQQEELQATNEDLEEQTKSLKESEEQLKIQQEELQATNEDLEEKTEHLEKQKNEIVLKNTEVEKSKKEIENKAKDLEEASRYKSEFLANMSHELRTPLNSLLILSKMLMDNEETNLTEDQVESASVIYSSGSDLLSLINEILDLSKVESGKMEIHLEDVRIDEIVSNIERNFRHVAQERGVHLEINVEEGLPSALRTDGQKLGQVLKNLLSNAFKFTEDGSVVVNIARPEVNVDFSQNGLDSKKAVAISVSDTGIGIPQEKHDLIFEAFKQVDGTTRRKYGGTGLGLSISKKFIGILGGEIILKSEHGDGTTITLYLPETLSVDKEVVDDVDVESKPKEEYFEAPVHSAIEQLNTLSDDRGAVSAEDKTLLIVEDDPKFAKILFDMAHSKGFKGIIASDGETGVKLASEYIPKAIILDIMLPGIDGWVVMDRLKDDPKTRHIPVHFISALDHDPDALKKGGIGYLSKPVSKDDLDGAFEKIENFIVKDIKNLLIVEVDESVQKNIFKLIESKGVQITCVKGGQEARIYLKDNDVDCVVLDAELPDMPVFELLQWMQEMLSQRVPVVIYTGKELSKEESVKLRQYADSIIVKGEQSQERLLDETALFLHCVEKNLSNNQQQMIRNVHDQEGILKNKKVLIVDDDMRNTFALSKALKSKGMDVFMAENGKVALERLKEQQDVDVVLMDIMMPVMDGFETIKEIREQRIFAKLPILALTAKAMKGDKEKCIDSGASDYLSKPVDMEKLFSMLRIWLYR